MNSQRRPELSGNPDTTPVALRGHWLTFAQIVCGIVASLTTALFVTSMPAYFERFRTLSVIHDAAYRDIAQSNLAQLGLSVSFYAGYHVALGVILATVCFAVAAVIFWRKSDEAMALFVALLLVLLGATFAGSIGTLGSLGPVWERLNSVLNALSLVFVFLFFYLFPSGRFAPRWMRWLAALYVAFVLPTAVFPDSPLNPENWTALSYTLLLSSWLLTGVAAQIYRYRRVSGPTQRQQTKWVVFGFAAALAGYLVVILLQVIFPSLEPGSLVDFIGAAVACCFMLLIPISFGIAILRYHLFDIDLIINRTLVYGTLTAALGILYLGGVVALQGIFRSLTGQGSTLAVVVSTLAIAALFIPLRRRIQNFIDRRFYRSKYDAARVLTAFSARLRDETNLDDISGDVVKVVNETLQPAHVSLWLRPPEKK